MIDEWSYPQSICVNGNDYPIRTDFRVVKDLLIALSDKDMQGETEEETSIIQTMLILEIMVPDYEKVKSSDIEGLVKGIIEFVDMGIEPSKNNVRIMDWEQDAGLIIPAVNRVLGKEIRAESYLHWWSFLSAYLEIGECTFSHIIEIRSKKAKGKKLEKWEQEYISENKNVVLLKEKLSEEEKEDLDKFKNELNDLLG